MPFDTKATYEDFRQSGFSEAQAESLLRAVAHAEERTATKKDLDLMRNGLKQDIDLLRADLDQLDTRLTSRIDQLDTRLGSRMDGLERELEAVEDRLSRKLWARLTSLFDYYNNGFTPRPPARHSPARAAR